MTTSNNTLVISGDWMVGDLANATSEQAVARLVAGMRTVSRLGKLALLNVEGPITAKATPIAKVGPNFRMAPRAAQLIAEGGYHIGLLANNHLGDNGPEGCLDTVSHLKAAGITPIGAGNNSSDALRPSFHTLDGITLGIIAATEHEFGLATDTSPGSAPLQLGRLFRVVADAKTQVDLVIVFVHGGCEYCPIPNPFIRQLYRDLVACGAHAVIGTHPHVPQGVEEYQGAPCIYSLGDFCFMRKIPPPVRLASQILRWSRGKIRTTLTGLPRILSDDLLYPSPIGMSIVLGLGKGRISLERIVFTRFDSTTGLVAMEEESHEHLQELIHRRSEALIDPQRYQKLWNAWCQQVGPQMLRELKLIPLSLRQSCRLKQVMLKLQNRVACEAHREVLYGACQIFADKTAEHPTDNQGLIALLQGWPLPPA